MSLGDLVPQDNFYRHLETTLDLGFVRELVRDAYAETGWPALDPVGCWTRQRVMCFAGSRGNPKVSTTPRQRL